MAINKLGWILPLVVLFSAVSYIDAQRKIRYSSIGKSTEKFAGDVYKQISAQNGNILISPISVQTVLGLVQIGSRSVTLQQMSKVLYLPLNPKRVAQIFHNIEKSNRNITDVVLNSASKIFIRDDVVLLEKYKNFTRYFDTEVTNTNMTNSAQAANEINGFVDKKTHGKIKEIIKEDDISDDTMMVLVNALYFDGKWEHPFEEEATHQKTFYANGEEEVKTDFMMQITKFRYLENEKLDAKFIELPYGSGDFVMTLVLPNERNGLPQLESKIHEVLKNQAMAEHETTVIMPKFKMEGDVNFNEVLQKLGMVAVFKGANLSGMSKGQLAVSKVVQKTYIDVNEAGTEAAAATGLSIEDRFGNDNRRVFYADHPFLFIIRQNSTGIVLFLGRYTGPQ
ncbi:Serpin 42Da [Carabus blaptoides fortunei]